MPRPKKSIAAEKKVSKDSNEGKDASLVYGLNTTLNKKLWKSIGQRVEEHQTVIYPPLVGSSLLLETHLATEFPKILHKKTIEDFAVEYFIHRHNQRRGTDVSSFLIRNAND